MSGLCTARYPIEHHFAAGMLPDNIFALIDTHTHFDVAEFDADRAAQAALAYRQGVRHLLIIGVMAAGFSRMLTCQHQLTALILQGAPSPKAHVAFGLHPFYITEHTQQDLQILENFIQNHAPVAVGEIGLDTYTDTMKLAENYARQQDFFVAQLDLASRYRLPVLLHIRRAHGDTLKILKAQKFQQGGIAHSFSGGIQEAKSLVAMGFKIGVAGQVTNPNAKKLRQTLTDLVKTVGLESLVIETDCPDFTPVPCHVSHGRRNVPANLGYVLDELCLLLQVEKAELAAQLWQNSCAGLQVDWQNPQYSIH